VFEFMVAFCNHLLQEGSFEDLRLHTYTISSFGPSAFGSANFPGGELREMEAILTCGWWRVAMNKSHRLFYKLWRPFHEFHKRHKKKLIFDEGVLGCPRKLGPMVCKWLISPTYIWGIP